MITLTVVVFTPPNILTEGTLSYKVFHLTEKTVYILNTLTIQGAKNRDLLCNWRGAVLGWWRRQTRRGLLGKCSTRRRLVPWYNRNSRILAALAAGKVFNAAEGSIRRHKIYGSCWKVRWDTVKSIQRYRKLFWFILGAADGRLAPFWKIHPFEKKRFSHLATN